MSTFLDMTLDDIIKAKDANDAKHANTSDSRPTRGSSSRSKTRSVGPTRNQRGSRIYKTPPAPPRRNVSDGSKIQISNLGPKVSQQDLKLVFSTRVGPLKKVILNYDQDGKTTGTALVHFTKVEDAARAMQKFSGVPLDGRPMKIELVIAPTVNHAILPPSMVQRSLTCDMNDGEDNGATTNISKRRRSNSQRKGRCTVHESVMVAARRGRSTTEDLDAELTNYMKTIQVNH